jgi:type II secretory pathway predicted ATPase ExeA
MYNEFFGFKAKPFQITPDQALLYMAPGHKEALACMEFGLIAETGIVLVTGEIGTGKTTLIQRFLTELPTDVKVASILNTNITPEQLLEIFLQEFGLSGHYQNKAEVIKAIETGLLNMRATKQRPLLIIDDAQNLSDQGLEEVRWLSNLQDDRCMLVQVILVGQPELKAKLSKPAMASLTQRIGVTYHLGAFTIDEVAAYMMHRLSQVGGSINLFTKKAVELIYETSKGIPRIINLLCDNALVSAFAEDTKIVNRSMVEQVVAEDSQNPLGAALMRLGTNGAGTSISNPKSAGSDQYSGNGSIDVKTFRKMETRMKALEKLVSQTHLEMRNMVKALLMTERQNSDRLLKENTLLKARNGSKPIRSNSSKAASVKSQNRRNISVRPRQTEILKLRKQKRQE